MDEHIGDNRNQMTEVNQDIATLRKEMQELKNLAKTVNDMNTRGQDLETFVAPIVDNNGAPMVAIVNSTHISSHIVRSIEMPLREIINATIEFKFDGKLKEDIVSSKVLGKVNNKFDALQQKMDEHIGDNRNQLTEVNQDIATLRKAMEELTNLAKTVNDMNSRGKL
ncbi:Hypothetical predicted protein [Mytilus galloprovincialis]|uniref:Uncharacterized protein n=1 Tax=Mytilus galloprovincialis TaxID=29158 RepID=A0A8B6C377_MYTGA|nr:Hypothetical predicted protein [Mytilus galloprovincialis]